MSYDLELVSKNGKPAKMMLLQTTGSVYKLKGKAAREAVDNALSSDIAITYNYSQYFYDATDSKDFTHKEEGKPLGIYCLDGVNVEESVVLIGKMISNICKKYRKKGEWISTMREETRYYNTDGKELGPEENTSAKGVKAVKKRHKVSEAPSDNYWDATAGNAVLALRKLLVMCAQCEDCDAVWHVT